MTVSVHDPFRARNDPALPTVALALDPELARSELKRRLPRLIGKGRPLRLKAIRVTRHKPGRRCVIEYDLAPKGSHENDHVTTIVGKIRAKRFGNESFRLLDQFWNAGFDNSSADHISVPEPLGVISEFQMWCQRKVPGRTAEGLLRGDEGIKLAGRIAEAIHKVHCAGVPTERCHTMTDELRILGECLAKTAELKPEWHGRLTRMNSECHRLGAIVREPKSCGIHRDFYPAQVIVDGEWLYLIDFDLYCLGDSALDVGNFIAHMTESALRELGDASALAPQEAALQEAFLAHAGEQCRLAVSAYTVLSIARHIYLSTQFPDRRQFTYALLELCEQRIGRLLAAQHR
jgi:hypothetical protein